MFRTWKELIAERDRLVVERDQLRSERDGYKGAYENLSQELNRVHGELGQVRAERLGYHDAYISVSHQLGDLSNYAVFARTTYEDTAAELRLGRNQRRPPRVPLQCGEHFLILANGRTGSTWLMTTLDQLPGVRCRKELRWKSPHTPFHAVHAYVDQTSPSLAWAIEAAAFEPGTAHVGTKLVVDPYWYTGPEIFADLAALAEPDIRFVVLKRRYAETWVSWKVRGVFHKVRQKTVQSGAAHDAELVRELDALAEPEPVKIGMSVDGKLLDGAAENSHAYSLAAAVDDMLLFFANDMGFLKLARERQSTVVDYGRLDADFPAIARFIGAAGAAAPEALTEKLADVSDMVTPRAPIDEFSAALDTAFWEVANGEAAPDEMWSFAPNHRARVGVPGFWELVAKYGLRRDSEWPLMKPVARV